MIKFKIHFKRLKHNYLKVIHHPPFSMMLTDLENVVEIGMIGHGRKKGKREDLHRPGEERYGFLEKIREYPISMFVPRMVSSFLV